MKGFRKSREPVKANDPALSIWVLPTLRRAPALDHNLFGPFLLFPALNTTPKQLEATQREKAGNEEMGRH